jgi:hypothetical protein
MNAFADEDVSFYPRGIDKSTMETVTGKTAAHPLALSLVRRVV